MVPVSGRGRAPWPMLFVILVVCVAAAFCGAVIAESMLDEPEEGEDD